MIKTFKEMFNRKWKTTPNFINRLNLFIEKKCSERISKIFNFVLIRPILLGYVIFGFFLIASQIDPLPKSATLTYSEPYTYNGVVYNRCWYDNGKTENYQGYNSCPKYSR